MQRSSAGRRKRTSKAGGIIRFKPKVLAIVAAIPEGRVTTYGTIGRHLRITARQVAFVMSRLTPEESEGLPWFRVVAANGFISTIKLGAVGRRQIERLREEGISINNRNKIVDFASVVWSPTPAARNRTSS
jgi:methylated-DNA-protein-cysteine methyltransferase-like protein